MHFMHFMPVFTQFCVVYNIIILIILPSQVLSQHDFPVIINYDHDIVIMIMLCLRSVNVAT